MVTASHVVNSPGAERVLLVIRKEAAGVLGIYEGKVLFNDEGLDMAVLKAEGMEGGTIALLATKPPPLGSKVYAAYLPSDGLASLLEKIAEDFPARLPLDSSTRDFALVPIKQGYVEVIRTMSWEAALGGTNGGKELDIIHLSVPLTFGASGAPLFDQSGRVIGVIAGSSYSSRLGLAGRISELVQHARKEDIKFSSTNSPISLDESVEATFAGPSFNPILVRNPYYLAEAGTRAGEERTFTIADGVEVPFIWCPPGEFFMGSPAWERGRNSDETRHRVTLTDGFWLAKTETTQGQWEAVAGNNPSEFKDVGSNGPVENVSWEDIAAPGGHLDKIRVRAPPGWEFALPTEAQWEYACRAGTKSAFSSGSNASTLAEYANFANKNFTLADWGNQEQDDGVGHQTAPVAARERWA